VSLFDLHGKVALVTGAGRGLGRGMALALASASARAIPWDLSDPDGLDELVEEAAGRNGRVDVLLHAAGVQVRKPAFEVTLEDWETVQAVHLRAAFFLSQAAARHMIERRAGGKILLVASLTSQIGVPNVAPCAAGKSGLMGLVRTLAVEWAPHSIQVNAVGPGYFRASLTEERLADPNRRNRLRSRILAGRPSKPEDLAGTTVFLASPASGYVTGQVINVDGGWLAG